MKNILAQDRKPNNQVENVDHFSFILSGDIQVCMSQELLPAQIAITFGNKRNLVEGAMCSSQSCFQDRVAQLHLALGCGCITRGRCLCNGFPPFFVCTPVYSFCWTRKSIWGKAKMTDRRLDSLTTCQLSCSCQLKKGNI